MHIVLWARLVPEHQSHKEVPDGVTPLEEGQGEKGTPVGYDG
jgi:hypothetical protein